MSQNRPFLTHGFNHSSAILADTVRFLEANSHFVRNPDSCTKKKKDEELCKKKEITSRDV